MENSTWWCSDISFSNLRSFLAAPDRALSYVQHSVQPGKPFINMDHWSAVHRTFSVETFLINYSVIAKQQIFMRHSNTEII